MTELMKRYEEKMDLKKDSIKMQYVYDRFIEGFEEFAQEEYDALQAENAKLKARIAELEKENERLRGIVHNLDHTLITNGVWSKV